MKFLLITLIQLALGFGCVIGAVVFAYNTYGVIWIMIKESFASKSESFWGYQYDNDIKKKIIKKLVIALICFLMMIFGAGTVNFIDAFKF